MSRGPQRRRSCETRALRTTHKYGKTRLPKNRSYWMRQLAIKSLKVPMVSPSVTEVADAVMIVSTGMGMQLTLAQDSAVSSTAAAKDSLRVFPAREGG